MEFSKMIRPSAINLEKVEPLNQKRTLAFLNHWVIQTVSFLNQFSAICETKLSEVDARLQQTEDALAILEAKLSSIPGLENVSTSMPASSQSQYSHPAASSIHFVTLTTDVETDQTYSQDPPTTVTTEPPSNTTNSKGGDAEADRTTVNAVVDQPISKDPRYATFFKMVSIGVPEQAVKLKMASQGLNPTLLDDPNAPAPPGLQKTTQQNESEGELSSWSD